MNPATNLRHGQLRRSGVVNGGQLDASFTRVRDGKPTGEKCAAAGEVAAAKAR